MSGQRMDQGPAQDPIGGTAEDLAKGVLAVVAVVLLTPFAVGIIAARSATNRVAQRAWFWRRRLWHYGVGVVGLIPVVVLLVVELRWVVGRVRSIDAAADVGPLASDLWPWLLANVASSVLVVPAAWLLARRRIAAKVAARTLPDATRQDHIIEARHHAAQLDARATAARAAGTSSETQRIGRRVSPGLRTLAERANTPRRVVRSWEHGSWVTLPSASGAVRAVVVAESGAGKTTLLTSTMLAALGQGWRVVFVDGKGQRSDADALMATVASGGHDVRRVDGVRVFSDEAEVEEMHAILTSPWPEVGGAGDFYRRRDRRAVAAALRGHPQTLDQLVEVMHSPPAGAPADVRAALEAMADKTTTVGEAAAASLSDAWAGVGDRLSHGLDFAALAPGLTVLTVRPSRQDEKLLGIASILAYQAHLARVQAGEPSPPILVVVDEFAQLVQGGTDPAEYATTLFETARSADLGIVLAAQSAPGLSAELAMRDRLLGSGAALLVGRTKQPEAIVSLAGTERRLEAAEAVEDSRITSGRSQDTFMVPPDRVRQAPPGVWWLIHEGAVAEFAALQPPPASAAGGQQPAERAEPSPPVDVEA